jgi:small subunit ribosomal protein S7
MSRKGTTKRRITAPDERYSDVSVARLINCIMRRGKKNLARKIVYTAFEKIEKEIGQNPVDVFKQAVENARPLVQVRSRRVGGATYQVPMEVNSNRSESMALRWFYKAVQKRPSRIAYDSLSKVILDAFKGVGDAMEERKRTHAMADANRAFIHFRW